MENMENKDINAKVRFEESMYRTLERMAHEDHSSIARLVRIAVEQFIRKSDGQKRGDNGRHHN